MALTDEIYRDMLLALSPPGRALPNNAPASVWTTLVAALAKSFTRVDERADDLQDEADPRSTLEMLEDWERVCGLPDECTYDATTLQERRNRVVATLLATGGQSLAYFASIAEALGYTVAIEEFRPFVCGTSRCGDTLNGPASVRHFWRIRVLGARVTWFRTGASRCGDALAEFAVAEDLECVFNRLKPAQTALVFIYEED